MIKLQVIGNLGQDAKITETNGRKVINFSVAQNFKFVDKDGVITEKQTWVNCNMWKDEGKSTNVASFLKKGTKVYVEGIPSVKAYEVEKEARASLVLAVHNLELLTVKDSKEETEEQQIQQE